jgi:hypothetical protein
MPANTPTLSTNTAPCKNCGQVLTGEYCPACGQRRAERITLKGLFHEAVGTILNLDRGLLHTIIELTIRPVQSFRDFLAGKRRPFMPPFQYLFVTVTAFLILYQLTLPEQNLAAEFEKGARESVQFNPDSNSESQQKSKQIQLKFFQFIKDLTNSSTEYFNLILILVVPCYSWAAYGLLRKLKLRFAEHLVLNAYIFAQQTLCSIFLFIPINFIPLVPQTQSERKGLVILYLILAIGYQIWVYTALFPRPTVRAGLLTILAIGLSWFIYWFLLMLMLGFAFFFFFNQSVVGNLPGSVIIQF